MQVGGSSGGSSSGSSKRKQGLCCWPNFQVHFSRPPERSQDEGGRDRGLTVYAVRGPLVWDM